GVLHLVVEVVTLTSTLTHTGEHGITAVLDGDVTDQFHHVHGLADTGTTEQTDLATLGERADQVDNLDAGFQQLVAAGLPGRAPRRAGDFRRLSFTDRSGFVDGVAQHVHGTAQGRFADRYRDGLVGAGDVPATLEAFGRTHRNGTHHAVAQLLLHFEGGFGADYFQRFINTRHLITWEFHVDNGADDLNDTSATHLWFL